MVTVRWENVLETLNVGLIWRQRRVREDLVRVEAGVKGADNGCIEWLCFQSNTGLEGLNDNGAPVWATVQAFRDVSNDLSDIHPKAVAFKFLGAFNGGSIIISTMKIRWFEH